MKNTVFITALLTIFFSCRSQQPGLDVNAPSFRQPFITLYKSTADYFKDVKGKPIVRAILHEPDTIGYELKVLPAGVTDWKHISIDWEGTLTVFFKLGEYSKDSAAVAKRFNDLVALVRKTDPTAVFSEDNAYSDTKVKEIYVCHPGAAGCTEDDRWRLHIFFHRMFDNRFNVSVNLQAMR